MMNDEISTLLGVVYALALDRWHCKRDHDHEASEYFDWNWWCIEAVRFRFCTLDVR